MEEKNKLKRNLTDEELDVFFRTHYPFQMYPRGAGGAMLLTEGFLGWG
jgi:hypothetical protein